MDIINVKTIAYKTIKSVTDIKLVTTSYPDTFTVYPTAIYSTAHNSYFRDGQMNESLTKWTITVDLFTNSGSLTDITNQLTALFGAMGFSNDIGDENLSGISRVFIKFTGIVDNETGRVYEK
ncbi:hypothetical protein LB941_06230 [Ligilactobacillus sp. WILCCON 0076]|uniref:Prophage protein n=1 Tax=Ligilactobacillus ubinensis TaxID=2876789 RepID=A0A9X2FKL1_9LACO|nr:hypothetical protein [Ligilactobacillus ubinensis]MCP0886929.1 hypothetical protein [Ligilactobacillus ubinensis]